MRRNASLTSSANTKVSASLVAASLIISVTLWLINSAFEAAGSVPDYEHCGYLAGSLPAVALLFPAAAAFVTFHVCRRLALSPAHSGRIPDSILVRLGGDCGIAAGVIYFGAGIALTLARTETIGLNLASLAIVAGCSIALYLGGRVGACIGLSAARRTAWQATEG